MSYRDDPYSADMVIFDNNGFSVIEEKNGMYSIIVSSITAGPVQMSEVYDDRDLALARAEYLSKDPEACHRIAQYSERLMHLERTKPAKRPFTPRRKGDRLGIPKLKIGDFLVLPHEKKHAARAMASKMTKEGSGVYRTKSVENGIKVTRVR